ncbi:hypothetical protein AC792_10190 [Arthrobacter sp. RIT-PI-e]|nr:hypothetical protein AC792_10190 [Arthrobacter sp. RIT-PI-e]
MLAVDGSGVLSVVSGNPTDEELAALTAVVVALQATEEAEEPDVRGRTWFRRAMLRLAPTPGPGSWRRSTR